MTAVATHPYITFAFDMRTVQPREWLVFGESMSKCQHLAGVPLKPLFALELSSIYLARGVQATTAIEGNTLSDEEVLKVVKGGSADVPDSRAYLEREVANVLGAVREIDAALANGHRLPITPERLKELNYKVLDGIPDKPEVIPGQFREHDVTAGPYRAPHWTEVPYLVKEFTDWLADLRSSINAQSSDSDKFVVAIVSAILAHLYIAWIHPFGNGNGRTARLIEVQILSESGVVPIVATNLLSDFYNKTRNAYYLALDAAQQDVGAFIRYAATGFLDELREQIKVVRQENLRVHWESHVYEAFQSRKSSPARARQRDVALALPHDRWVTPEAMTELSAALAKKYAQGGGRMPARDLNDLVAMNLVERRGKRHYRARREIIEAFIPPVSQ